MVIVDCTVRIYLLGLRRDVSLSLPTAQDYLRMMTHRFSSMQLQSLNDFSEMPVTENLVKLSAPVKLVKLTSVSSVASGATNEDDKQLSESELLEEEKLEQIY